MLNLLIFFVINAGLLAAIKKLETASSLLGNKINPIKKTVQPRCAKNSSDWFSNDYFKKAVKENSPENLEGLAKSGVDIKACKQDGVTALMSLAARSQSPKLVKALIDSGSDINRVDQYGDNALMYAAKNSWPVFNLLLKAHGSVLLGINFQNYSGNTPLHYAAAFSRDKELVEKLIDAGAYIDMPNNAGNTPLMLAAQAALEKDNFKIIKTLLEAGADAKLKNLRAESALGLLLQGNKQSEMPFKDKKLNETAGLLYLAQERKNIAEPDLQQFAPQALKQARAEQTLWHFIITRPVFLSAAFASLLIWVIVVYLNFLKP